MSISVGIKASQSIAPEILGHDAGETQHESNASSIPKYGLSNDVNIQGSV